MIFKILKINNQALMIFKIHINNNKILAISFIKIKIHTNNNNNNNLINPHNNIIKDIIYNTINIKIHKYKIQDILNHKIKTKIIINTQIIKDINNFKHKTSFNPNYNNINSKNYKIKTINKDMKIKRDKIKCKITIDKMFMVYL